jgi:phospholipid transport system substrate-binding protein
MRPGPIYRGVTMLRPCALVLGLALAAVSDVDARAATPTAELRAFFTAATQILTDPATEGQYAERLHAIRTRTRQIFDAREAARLALGPAWRERTPPERDRFVELYANLLERAFIAWIGSRVQIADGPRVSFIGETIDEGYATVRTTVLGRSGDEVALDYRMVERGDGWAVRDVVIDGMSLAANYRAQFTRVIQNASYAELVRQMESRTSAPPPAVLVARPRSAEPAAREAADAPAAPVPRLVAVAPSDTKPLDLGTRPALVERPAASPKRGARSTSAPTPSSADSASASRPPIFWVQVAAFKNPEAAAKLAAALRAGKAPIARPPVGEWAVVTTSDEDVARVRVGPFADRAEAELGVRRLAARGYKGFIAEDRERAK